MVAYKITIYKISLIKHMGVNNCPTKSNGIYIQLSVMLLVKTFERILSDQNISK